MSDNLDHSIQSHYGNVQDDMTPDQQCSIMLSKALDCLGYTQDMVKYRVAYWKMRDDIENIKVDPNRPIQWITAGSQTEGVTGCFGTDLDAMCVNLDCICTDTPYLIIGDRKLTIFQTVNHDTAPGYTKLRLFKMGHSKWNDAQPESLIQSECGDIYLCSDLYTKELMTFSNKTNRMCTSKTLTQSGPALPIYYELTPDIVHDVVHAFKCHCPSLLRYWLRRPRRNNWPPRNVLYELSQMDAHVVPVGCKGSDTYNMEWRICFTKAEIHLIHCLNDTQTKLYIVLKMISKQILKSLCSEVTSYIMKNIVLWTCEYCPSDLFINNQLWCSIFQALVFLKKCVTQNFLPSYMIPERNLLNGRIEPEEKLKLTVVLSMLIEEGPPTVFKRIDKLRDSMLFVHRAPEMADYNRIQRDLVEKIFSLMNIRWMILNQPVMSDEELDHVLSGDKLLITLGIALQNLVLPEWRTLSQRGVNDSKIDKMINDKVKALLS